MIDALPVDTNLNKVDVWFQDETRVGQQGSITRMWAPRGTRPSAIRQQQFEYAYIFWATCPAQDKALGLILPLANTDGMIEHLRLISQSTPKDRYAVVIMDRAAWHTTSKITCFDNVVPIPLPPYAPELNPVEQLWLILNNDIYQIWFLRIMKRLWINVVMLGMIF
ncbi:MAG: IS630 family transposase [Candidatus Thioglobus sp.]|uniref:IS630 family transposase n=1 Tax=Candidatus Thioglobus sp. TaxID=2026721 RepID=UPI002602046C|nr:IS630 family transposase [Candidatus Thioglobus sp.]MDC9727640.1 IS630 family transposase [Candidatus Thioglobus sp.]